MTDSEEPIEVSSHEPAMLREIDQLGVLYSETENPVFVWLALALQQRERGRQRLRRLPNFDLYMPHWIEQYLLSSAEAVGFLVSGVKIKHVPNQAGSFLIQDVDHDLAMERLPSALGLTKQGSNAFKDYKATAGDVVIAKQHHALKQKGLKGVQILEMMSKDANKEQTVVRKRITRGKRLIALLQSLETLHSKRTPPN